MTIELKDFLDKNKSVALIVEAHTGIKYLTTCDGPKGFIRDVEGFLIPLPKFDTTKYPLFCASWWTINHDAECVLLDINKDFIIKTLEEALNSKRMSGTKAHNFKVVDIPHCCEAWIPLEFDLETVEDTEKYNHEMHHMHGILTWANSN